MQLPPINPGQVSTIDSVNCTQSKPPSVLEYIFALFPTATTLGAAESPLGPVHPCGPVDPVGPVHP